MAPRNLFLITGLLIGLMFSLSSGQRFPFRIYNVREGLTQSQVQSIVQDGLGYLWFGTRDGVAIYDGYNFHSLSNKDGLEANYIITSYLDSRGNIWFTHRTRGISRINSLTRKFDPVSLPAEMEDVQIEHIVEDDQGRFWFATSGKGVFILSDSTWYAWTMKDGLPSETINDIAFGDNQIWLATDKGLIACKTQYDKLEIVWKLDKNSSLGSDNITRVLIDRRGNVWAGTGDAGTVRITMSGPSVSGWQFKRYFKKSSFGSHIIQALYEDLQKRIWIGARDGVAIVTDTTITYLNEEQGLSYHDVI
jgi:ligand-binding sensor domain-containing protein